MFSFGLLNQAVSVFGRCQYFCTTQKTKLYYYKEKKITPAWLNQAGVSTFVVVQQVNGAALLVQKFEYGHLRYVFSFGLLN